LKQLSFHRWFAIGGDHCGLRHALAMMQAPFKGNIGPQAVANQNPEEKGSAAQRDEFQERLHCETIDHHGNVSRRVHPCIIDATAMQQFDDGPKNHSEAKQKDVLFACRIFDRAQTGFANG
jgi:hypothetical protein